MVISAVRFPYPFLYREYINLIHLLSFLLLHFPSCLWPPFSMTWVLVCSNHRCSFFFPMIDSTQYILDLVLHLWYSFFYLILSADNTIHYDFFLFCLLRFSSLTFLFVFFFIISIYLLDFSSTFLILLSRCWLDFLTLTIFLSSLWTPGSFLTIGF
jgi:hypothetical protein